MKSNNPTNNDLQKMANKLRIHSIKSTTQAGSGHPTSCMSCAEIMSTLFFSEIKKDDEFILSKGHAVPILWAVYAEAGIIPVTELKNLRKINSNLEGHPTPRMPMIKVATGSLGQGLGAGVGMALAKRLQKNNGKIFVLLGDGEVAEGSVWESANTAAYYKLNNLVAIVDVNRLGQSQETMHGHNVNTYKKKFQAFGWNSIAIEGHNIEQIKKAISKSKKSKKPLAIIAKTYKGKGVSFLDDKEGWHGKPLSKEDSKKAIKELGDTKISLNSSIKVNKIKYQKINFKLNSYKKQDQIATRDAFGKALLNSGKQNKSIVAIDGDVKNSTKMEAFFKEFPDRGFQSFIAIPTMFCSAIND
jgi:transketolase